MLYRLFLIPTGDLVLPGSTAHLATKAVVDLILGTGRQCEEVAAGATRGRGFQLAMRSVVLAAEVAVTLEHGLALAGLHLRLLCRRHVVGRDGLHP